MYSVSKKKFRDPEINTSNPEISPISKFDKFGVFHMNYWTKQSHHSNPQYV